MIVVLFTTISWLIATYVSSGKETIEQRAHLKDFYTQIKPQGKWNTIAYQINSRVDNKSMLPKFIVWICTMMFAYNCLFLIGNYLLSNNQALLINIALAAVSGLIGGYLILKKRVLER